MKLKNKIFIHLAFWFYLINQGIFPYYIGKQEPYFIEMIISYTIGNVFVFYSFYALYPLLFSLKNKLYSIIIILILLAILSVLRFGFEYTYEYNILNIKKPNVIPYDTWFYNDLRLVIINFIYSLLIKFAIGWFESQKLKSDLINQNQSSELALLRSQVNPHFLFNTLNNIYSLVYKKSDDAPAAVMKLSSIMRYMLYDATSDKVLLEKEIEYLYSFVELQKLRSSKNNFVEIKLNGDIHQKTIAPMLLIPFVENAFKHGNKNVPSPGIRIQLNVTTDSIEFEVINYIRITNFENKDAIGGIGLNNIKRRLELLYPGKHTLSILQSTELFTVKLKIFN
ncbi:MAG: histidine kinase [Lentimicrobiaceae bacterium]|nr:histidine kinase [Lentimicrobiaceae bacterium]